MKRLYRSLSLIVFINIGLLLIYQIIVLIIAGDALKNHQIISVNLWLIISYLAVINIIGLAANVPILFINRYSKNFH